MTGNEFAADTSAVIALERNDPRVIRVFNEARAIHLPFPVRAEMLVGAYRSSRIEENLRRVEEIFTRCRAIPSDDAVERSYATITVSLRRKGRPIPANDIWIAACAIAKGLPSLSLDGHFMEIEGLRSISIESSA
jgi:tRNA(fMet)-specific endonuclease VapC